MMKSSFIVIEQPDSFGSFEPFAEVLRQIKKLGFDGAELHLAGPSGYEIDALCRLSETIDLPIVSFLTGCNYFREGLCLSSPRAEARQKAVERLRSYTRVAARFRALLVLGQMQGFLTDEPDKAVGEARIEESLKPVVEAAEKNGVTIAFEPVNHLQAGFHNTLADVKGLADRLGSPRLRPMLDTFHMNIEEKSMIEPIERIGQELAHFHLCESNGSFLGSGHCEIRGILTALEGTGYSGYFSTKVYRHPWSEGAPAVARYLRDIGQMARGCSEA